MVAFTAQIFNTFVSTSLEIAMDTLSSICSFHICSNYGWHRNYNFCEMKPFQTLLDIWGCRFAKICKVDPLGDISFPIHLLLHSYSHRSSWHIANKLSYQMSIISCQAFFSDQFTWTCVSATRSSLVYTTFAIFSPIRGTGLSARAGTRLNSSAASSCAFCPRFPFTPLSINCVQKPKVKLTWHHSVNV